jgi:hypothetical protein
MTCKEWSEANQCQVYVEGEETCVDSPLFGGKAKVSSQLTFSMMNNMSSEYAVQHTN